MKWEKSHPQAETRNTTIIQLLDFLEEKAQRGNIKGSKEGISLGKKEGRAYEEDISRENK